MLKNQKYCIGIVISSGLLSFRACRGIPYIERDSSVTVGMTYLLTKCHIFPFGLLFDVYQTKQ